LKPKPVAKGEAMSGDKAPAETNGARDLLEGLRRTERHLGLRPGTITSLVTDPDYLLLIKATAVIEPVLGDLIRLGFSQPTGGLGGRTNSEIFGATAESVIKNCPLDGRLSKIEFAMTLGVIDQNDANFIKAISSMRNRYAHTIVNSERTARSLLLDRENEISSTLKRLSYGSIERLTSDDDGELKFIIVAFLSIFLERAIDRLQPRRNALAALLLGIDIEPKPSVDDPEKPTS